MDSQDETDEKQLCPNSQREDVFGHLINLKTEKFKRELKKKKNKPKRTDRWLDK